jgi:hypothetical protein
LTTNNCTPASSQAATILLPSTRRVAIGFSVITCRPPWGDLDRMLRMQTTRSAQRHDVCFAAGQELFDAVEAWHIECGTRLRERLAIGIADGDEFGAFPVGRNRVRVAVRDPAATHDRKTQFAVGNPLRCPIGHVLPSC